MHSTVIHFCIYSYIYKRFSSVWFSASVMSNSLWPHGLQHARLPCPSPAPKLTQTHVHQIDDTFQPSHPLLSPSPLTFNLSQYQYFSSESVFCIRWLEYWSFRFSISPANDYSGMISFRFDRLDVLAVQKTLQSLLQNHSSKASILWCSTFFIVQLSHPYMATRKMIALTRRTFAGKVMSLLFDMLSRLAIDFLPRRKHLLLSWLQLRSAVILEPKKIVCHCFHCIPIYLPWSDGTRCHVISFLNAEF